jgi:hypothetical protein
MEINCLAYCRVQIEIPGLPLRRVFALFASGDHFWWITRSEEWKHFIVKGYHLWWRLKEVGRGQVRFILGESFCMNHARSLVFRRFTQSCEKRLFDSSCFRVEQLDTHWTDFDKIWYLSLLRKPVLSRKFKFHSNPTRITGSVARYQKCRNVFM